MVSSLETRFQVGSRYRNFVVTRVVKISEIKCTLYELIHEPTGAQVMHLENDDEENLFCLSFRTLPESSDGVAHILEHTVLCGSEKFPVRDPFFGMTRRSLNTYMNALTGPDFTCYPAASQVPKDFYNLLDVYLDAVFHPQLNKLSFLQEGHRLELSDPDNLKSALVYKGIVFNEMKGALASPESRLSEELMKALFPNLTYGFNSGGDPKEIPTLNYEKLKEFHQTFYHPSRCLFFFYGNLPLEKHLDFIEEHALKGVEKLPSIPLLPKQPRFKEKVRLELAYPMAENEDPKDKTYVAFSWLTCSILQQEELLALSVIELVLMGTDAAPLKMALLKSGLCKQADSSLDSEISEAPFSLICKGCPEDSAARLEALVQHEFERYYREGLPEHLIQGAIHQLEFSRAEITGNSAPFGLSLFMRSALIKQHGGNPEDGLRIHTLFKRLRERVRDKHYLPELIKTYFIDNTHYVRLVLKPDKTLAAKELEEEKLELEKIHSKLTPGQLKELVAQAKELEKRQEEQEDQNIDFLPKVTLADVSKEAKEFDLTKEKIKNVLCYHHSCFTNEIVYADLVFDLPEISEEELPILRLFTLLLTQLGCGGRDYKETLDSMLLYTGGIGASLDLSIQAEDYNATNPCLTVKGKALYRNSDKLFPMMRDFVLSADFSDVERVKELLMQHYQGLENSIHHRALGYAVSLAASGLTIPGHVLNAWTGMDYYWKIKELIQAFATKPEPLIEKFEALKTRCLGLKGAHLVLSCDEKIYKELKNNTFYGLLELPEKSFVPWSGKYPLPAVASQGRITASPVAFTVMMFKSLSYIHPETVALSVASEIMENKVLHKRIREQGGAYGAGAVNGVMAGNFYLYSYRDPHVAATLNAFRESIKELASGQFEARDLDEAKLGILQDLDVPCAPGSRAIIAYLRLRSGRTHERRQAFRDQLLAMHEKEVGDVTKKQLLSSLDSAIIVTFGGKKLLEKENTRLRLPLFPVESHV